MLRTISTSLAAAVLLAAMPVAAAPVPVVSGEFRPAEGGCARRPGGAVFLAAFTRAVQRRDATALLALSSPTIQLDFGGGSGQAELRRRLSGAEGRKLWRELDRLLAQGCAARGHNLYLPAVFARDLGDLDPFETLVVTGAAVPLRVAPSAAARPLRLLSWVAVTPLTGDDYEQPFRRVSLPGGKVTGYVETAKLRSPLDYRLVVSRRRGAWKIDAFVAGD